MNIEINPSRLSGSVKAPPSKSFAHRLLIAAAPADSESRIENIALSGDIRATLECIAALGADCAFYGNSVRVCPGKGENSPVFNCGESGSTLRFLMPLSLVLCGGGEFRGSTRLIERGISEYERIFAEKGVNCEKSVSSIKVSGKLTSGEYALRGDVSSQFISGLLFALPLTEGDSRLDILPPVESRGYIDITLKVLEMFGISINKLDNNRFIIPGGQKYCGGDFRCEGDWSNAAVLLALKALGHDIDVTGLDAHSVQGDRRILEFLDTLLTGGSIDVSDTPDLAPLLIAFASLNCGANITGTRRLRLKESNRAEAIAHELKKFGADIRIYDNSVDIIYSSLHSPAVPLDSHNDHRIAMALTLPCLRFGGTITGAEAVYKSWPEFFDIIKAIPHNAARADAERK